MRARLATAGAVLAAAVIGFALGAPATHGSARAPVGSPERGKVVYASSDCVVCHDFAPSGRAALTPGVAPDLGTALAADAGRAHQALGPFTLQSIVDPSAYKAAGFPATSMQSYAGRLSMQQIDDLVSFLIGSPYSSGVAVDSTTPAAVCDRTAACKALVERWVKAGHLAAAALQGAKVFAASGCLACHRYLGSGTRGVRAPDLSAEGRRHRGLAWQIGRLKCPQCVNPATRMPTFANLGTVTRRQVAVFLEASGTLARP